MLSKSLPHIIINKWIFIDLMSNLMATCATWRIWSWSFIHIVNSFTPIPWNSSNYASILLIKFKFTIFHSYSHNNTFCYYWLRSWQDYNFLYSYKYWLNSFASKHGKVDQKVQMVKSKFLIWQIFNINIKKYVQFIF
jgi:hypothetical protein